MTSGAGRIKTYSLSQLSAQYGYKAVKSVTSTAGTWNYAYSDVLDSGASAGGPGTRTVTVTDPLGHTRVVTSRLPAGQILTDQNGAGGVTTYGYTNDSSSRGAGFLNQITSSEGDSVKYVYDSRGNVLEQHYTSKPSSGLSDRVITASYPSTCTNTKTCNKPDWVMDAKANAEHAGDANYRTDFIYDPNHGAVLTATGPIGANGVRPQTRYTYAQFTAMYYHNGATTLTAGTPVWRLTRTSKCATGTAPSCVGTADETVTTIGYESRLCKNAVSWREGWRARRARPTE